MEKESELKQAFGSAGEPPAPPAVDIKPVARPVSKMQIDELYKQLSEPKIRPELTPMGPASRQVHREHDQLILAEIEAIRHRLALRRGAAKEAFDRARHEQTRRSWKR